MAERDQFFAWLEAYLKGRPTLRLEDIMAQAGGPKQVALAAVDVINGFCCAGPLASERVSGIVDPVRQLVENAQKAGIERIAYLCDAHTPDAPEFASFPPHCIAGSVESQLVPELTELAQHGTVIAKNATSAWHEKDYNASNSWAQWVAGIEQAGVNTVITVGDCTDLCIYQLALPLKLRANSHNRQLQVIVPMNCVDTYDLPTQEAEAAGILPHPGDIMHNVFLYHLALNGCEVVKAIL